MYYLPATPNLNSKPSWLTIVHKFIEWQEYMTDGFSTLQKQGGPWFLYLWKIFLLIASGYIPSNVYLIGLLHTHKACLVTNDFHQEHDIDYSGTFSPIVKKPTVRLILAPIPPLIGIYVN